MPNLRGGKERREEGEEEVKAESDEEFDFQTSEETNDGYGGSDWKREPEPEPIKQGGSKAKKGSDDEQGGCADEGGSDDNSNMRWRW